MISSDTLSLFPRSCVFVVDDLYSSDTIMSLINTTDDCLNCTSTPGSGFNSQDIPIGVPNCSKAFLKLFWFLLGTEIVALYEQAGYKSLIVLVFSRLLFLTFQEQMLSVELQL